MLEEILYPEGGMIPHPLFPKREETVFAEILADGHYWRTAAIRSASLLFFSDGRWVLHSFAADPSVESDEYSILEGMSRCLPESAGLATYNGTSFMLPFLAAKYKAYMLGDPFAGRAHTDLFYVLKPLYELLGLPSRRTADLLAFLGEEERPSGNVSRLTQLLPYLHATSQYSFLGAEHIPSEDLAVFRFRPAFPVPRETSFRMGSLRLVLRNGDGILSSRLFDGRLRRYYPDPANYYYMPHEGQAVHRSLAAFIPKERLVPAEADTCFTYFSATPAFFADPAAQSSYLASSLRFLEAVCGIRK